MQPLEVSRRPVCLSVAILQGYLLIDPSEKERAVAEAVVTAIIDVEHGGQLLYYTQVT